jgi:hypothetical protein
MIFGTVQGVGLPVDTARFRLIVTLDDRRTVRQVREETVPYLPGGPASDLAWQVDQYTQETIGTLLAEEGWEPLSTTESDPAPDGGLACSPTYLVRRV